MTNASIPPQGRARHAVVAVVMQLMVSVVYSWSVFRGPLSTLHGWSKAQTIMPYRYTLICVAAGAMLGGLWQDRRGSRLVATVGGLLMAAGCTLSALYGGAIGGLVLFYGVLTGLGSGFAYVTPIANLVKWFPDKRGTMVGLAVMGSGLSPLFWSPLIERWIGKDPSRLAETIPRTFGLEAAIFLIVLVGAAQFYRVPPPGWKPAGWIPPATARPVSTPTRGVLATWQFYAIWVMFFLSASVGLTAIGQASLLVQEAARASAPISAGVVVGIVGVFNGAGRLSWGAVSDRTGRKIALLAMSAVSAIACSVFLHSAAGFGDVMVGLCLVAFTYGGCLAVMPSLVADFYGDSSIGGNYGLVFSAWGVCGFVVPGYFEGLLDRARAAGNLAGGYHETYWTLAAFSLTAGVIASVLRAPRSLSPQLSSAAIRPADKIT
jgi:MFS transporter, OFA family, oxalate/formate antiporter